MHNCKIGMDLKSFMSCRIKRASENRSTVWNREISLVSVRVDIRMYKIQLLWFRRSFLVAISGDSQYFSLPTIKELSNTLVLLENQWNTIIILCSFTCYYLIGQQKPANNKMNGRWCFRINECRVKERVSLLRNSEIFSSQMHSIHQSCIILAITISLSTSSGENKQRKWSFIYLREWCSYPQFYHNCFHASFIYSDTFR